MHNNEALNKHCCAIFPETGLMRETLVRLLLPSSLPRAMLLQPLCMSDKQTITYRAKDIGT